MIVKRSSLFIAGPNPTQAIRKQSEKTQSKQWPLNRLKSFRSVKRKKLDGQWLWKPTSAWNWPCFKSIFNHLPYPLDFAYRAQHSVNNEKNCLQTDRLLQTAWLQHCVWGLLLLLQHKLLRGKLTLLSFSFKLLFIGYQQPGRKDSV